MVSETRNNTEYTRQSTLVHLQSWAKLFRDGKITTAFPEK